MIPKLKDSPYKVQLEQENGNSSFLSLWNELNKENYGLLEQLVQYMDWGPQFVGNESFHIGTEIAALNPVRSVMGSKVMRLGLICIRKHLLMNGVS